MAPKSGQSEAKTVSVERAGELLGIGRNQAYEAARRGEIHVIRIGKRLLVPNAWLDRVLSGQFEADTGSEI